MGDRWFQLNQHGTTVGREVLAGVTTFTTMAYIIVVNPKILEDAGIPFGPSMVATILTAFLGTLLMGLYANRPFAIAPYMGQNAFIAYTVVGQLGHNWQTALGAILISGVLFTVLTLLKLRSWLARAIPESLRIGFAVGIGFFLAFIGLSTSGIVTLGTESAPVQVGNLRDPAPALAVAGFFFIALLYLHRVRGALVLGILATGAAGWLLGLVSFPARWVSAPPAWGPVLLQLDIVAALQWGFISVILTIVVMDFVDTIGTLLGVGQRAGMLDANGELPEVEKPMLCDAVATIAAALFGTTTAGTYIESAAGVETGGRTGLTAVVTAILFLFALFLAPIVEQIPSFAYGPALVFVGLLMVSPLARLDFNDLTEVLPVFMTIALMSFTYNLGIGLTGGLVSYPLCKLLAGRAGEVTGGMWGLGGVSLLLYIFYPY